MSKVEEKTKAPSECSANLVGESKKIDNLAGVEKLKVKTMNGVVNGVSEIKGKGQAKNSKRTVKGKQVNGTEPLVTTKKHHKDHDESHNNHVTNHNVTNDLVDGVTKEESGGLLNKPDLNKDNAAVGTGSESKKEVNGLSENATKNEQELSPKNSKNIDAKTCLNEETLSSKCDVVAAVENLQIDGPTQILQTSIADCKTAGRDDILYVQYESELQMTMIMKIIQKDLSEPYSIYTYRYFIHNWPNLCFLAMYEDKCVGAIVCKLDIHRKVIKRGYIAMLAVDKDFRKSGIGSTLVKRAIQEMISGDADEVVLETEITNKPALRLYEALGFVRDKRLFRYYLNGVDALRLKLWLR